MRKYFEVGELKFEFDFDKHEVWFYGQPMMAKIGRAWTIKEAKEVASKFKEKWYDSNSR